MPIKPKDVAVCLGTNNNCSDVALRDRAFDEAYDLPPNWTEWETNTYSSYIIATHGGLHTPAGRTIRDERRRRKNREYASEVRKRGARALDSLASRPVVDVRPSVTLSDRVFDAKYSLPNGWANLGRVDFIMNVPAPLQRLVRTERRKRLQRGYVAKRRVCMQAARQIVEG